LHQFAHPQHPADLAINPEPLFTMIDALFAE